MNQFFIEALDLQAHPIRTARKGVQTDYIIALSCIVEKVLSQIEPQRLEQNQNHFQCPNLHNLQVQPFENNPKYRLIAVLSAALNKQVEQYDVKQFVNERLRSYRCQLFSDVQFSTEDEKRCLHRIATFARPWRSKYRYMLVCDAALILLEEPLILRAVEIIKGQFPTKLQIDIEQFFSLLQSKQAVHKKYLPTSSLLEQYRANTDFFSKPEKRIIVTANTSAGKSTLINALIGKPIARTSEEACTGNVCYLFNKAYEDGNIHLSAQNLSLRATAENLQGYDWTARVSIASYFAAIIPDIPRLCIIDTPGVDATALYKSHLRRARDALLNDTYDTIVYIVGPTRLGTDAEKKHLRWVAQHLQKDKIIFVLNKLDNYHASDSIDESMHKFKEDLIRIGFENPVICPISAYVSYLLKLKMTGQALSADEEDEYAYFSKKKFMRSCYDLSHYYEGVQCLPTDSEEITLSKRIGLYGLEKIIYGGNL